MEERLPPTNDGAVAANNNNNLPIMLTAGPEESLETYIVQIPRNQVYRVPPPEHARIVEEYHTRNTPEKKKHCGGILGWTVIAFILLGILAGITVLILRSTMYSPNPPEFSIAHIRSKNPRNPPEYDVLLRASNPNARMSIAYHGPGDASLVFMNQKIGQGGFPKSHVKENPNANMYISVVLSAKGINVPADIKKGLNDTTKVKAMVLKIAVPMEVNSWVKNENRDLTIACDFRVQGALTEKTAANKVMFQECRSDF